MAWTPDRDTKIPDIHQFAALNGLSDSEAKQALEDALSYCPYNWDEISGWLKKRHKSMRSRSSPASPPWICPSCSIPMRWTYWENDTPPEWQCGRGGWVEICETCEWWGRYQMGWMS